MNDNLEEVPSSFRDPSGFLFFKNKKLYRQINKIYKEHYDHLMNSGLYKTLTESNLLVKHEEVDISPANSEIAYKLIKPEPISFISYPYEWCFSQLKEAALTTIRIQKIAIEFGMSLKDASAYNIQFKNGKPIFIDTLSFEKLKEGKPWVAYRQFCQHFLAPLTLMAYKDHRLNQLSKTFIDGIPVNLASKILPFYTRFIPGIAIHIHAHAFSQKYFSSKTVKIQDKRIKHSSYIGLINHLESTLKKMTFRSKKSEWGDYYEETNYSEEAFEHKKQILEDFLSIINPTEVWDLGANTGIFSRIASSKGIKTISFDIDPIAVEKNYQECMAKNETNLVPLLLDLTNPSPAIGWENRERLSLIERGPTDTVFALALVHHLAISNNLPFDKIATFFRGLCKSLVIEFVSKSDSQIQRLLSAREDIFSYYTQKNFELEFSKFFEILRAEKIKNSERILYLMQVIKT
jgi:ribosomal protein L11 methylase PrmA